MRSALSIAAVVLAIAFAAGPAHAGFGAIAYDQDNGKTGSSFNQATPAKANEAALRQCASPGCRVYPVEPKGCGALALSDKDKAWGGADRENLEEAKKDAVLHCQRHTQDGNCAVKVSDCNK